jgi:hypothetical protein
MNRLRPHEQLPAPAPAPVDVADFLDEVLHTSGMELLLEQIRGAAGSSLAAQTLADSQAHHEFDVTVPGCKSTDGKWNCRPHGATVMEPHTQLIALGHWPCRSIEAE